MVEIDDFARMLFEEAKRFFEKGSEVTSEGQMAYFHAAISLGFSSLEAHVNAIADELLMRNDLTLLDRALLLEKNWRLRNGQFEIEEQRPWFFPMPDRLEYICQRYTNYPINKRSAYWSRLNEAIDLRNRLIHPKLNNLPEIDPAAVKMVLSAILDILNVLYNAVYGKPYPAFGRRLHSSMNF